MQQAAMAAVFTAAMILAVPAAASDSNLKKSLDRAATQNADAMSDGEVRKVDKDAGKITLKHGEIKNIQMPPMTMVFRVKDQAMLGQVKQGDKVRWHITSTERAVDATHGFAIAKYNINLSLEPGESETVSFVADAPGVFPYYCTEFCSALHLEMTGYLLVEPR